MIPSTEFQIEGQHTTTQILTPAHAARPTLRYGNHTGRLTPAHTHESPGNGTSPGKAGTQQDWPPSGTPRSEDGKW